MLDDVIEVLTKLMLENEFENKEKNKKIVINETDLYKFCIKLIKEVKNTYNE